MSTLYNFIFRFPDAAAAQRDPVVGPYFVPGRGALEVCVVYGNVNINSVVPEPNYWVMVGSPTLDLALLNHPNIQLVNNRTAQLAGEPSVVLANVDISHIGIIVNSFSNYVTNGLQKVS